MKLQLYSEEGISGSLGFVGLSCALAERRKTKPKGGIFVFLNSHGFLLKTIAFFTIEK